MKLYVYVDGLGELAVKTPSASMLADDLEHGKGPRWLVVVGDRRVRTDAVVSYRLVDPSLPKRPEFAIPPEPDERLRRVYPRGTP